MGEKKANLREPTHITWKNTEKKHKTKIQHKTNKKRNGQ
jgi:hypothetical protein